MSCCNDALPGSVYCSNQCILKHAKESLMSVVKVRKMLNFEAILNLREISTRLFALKVVEFLRGVTWTRCLLNQNLLFDV